MADFGLSLKVKSIFLRRTVCCNNFIFLYRAFFLGVSGNFRFGDEENSNTLPFE